jgi:hypothetical protein
MNEVQDSSEISYDLGNVPDVENKIKHEGIPKAS